MLHPTPRRPCGGSDATSGSPTTRLYAPRSTRVRQSCRSSSWTPCCWPRPVPPGRPGCWRHCTPSTGISGRPGRPGLSVVPAGRLRSCRRSRWSAGRRQVHISSDFGPYGRSRDDRVEAALTRSGLELRRTGSPYAVAPGTLSNGSGGPFQVFSPFHRAWLDHGVHDPAPGVRASTVNWLPAKDRVTVERPGSRRWPSWPGRNRPAEPGRRGCIKTPRVWRTTPSCTTSPVPTRPRTCPSPSAGATCTRGPCCTISHRSAPPEQQP